MAISLYNQPISFKKHIPIAKCAVKDRITEGKAAMTLSELDCNDIKDLYDIEDLQENRFDFREPILINMANKYLHQGNTQAPDYSYYITTGAYDYNRLYERKEKKGNFYVMESPRSGIVGICQTHREDDNVLVDYIATKKESLYKYVGQTMLTALAKKALTENATKFIISDPVSTAFRFYKNKCGFKEDNYEENFYMNEQDIQEFEKRTKEKTQSSIEIIG